MPPAVNHLHGDRLTVQAYSALVVVSPDRSEHLLTRAEKITDIQLNTQLWSSFMFLVCIYLLKSVYFIAVHIKIETSSCSDEHGLFNLISMSIHSSIYLYPSMFHVSYTLSPPLYIYIYTELYILLFKILEKCFR